MDAVENNAVQPERGSDAETVATTERQIDYLESPERGVYAPSCSTVHGSAESPEIVMYEDEDEEMDAAAMATEFEHVESPEKATAAAVSGNAESSENIMFEGEDSEFRATRKECEALKSLEFLLNEAAEAAFPPPYRANAESPEVLMYNGDDVDFPAVEIEEEKDESPEFVMHDGDDPAPVPMPESLNDEVSCPLPERAIHAIVDATSSLPAVVNGTDEASDSTPARGGYVNLDSIASLARGSKSKAKEGGNLSLEETEDGTPARVTNSFANAAKIVPVTEEEATAETSETSERGAYEEAVPAATQLPAKKKGEKHSPMPERGSFSIPAEGASHEEYMEAWLRIDATAAGEELMRLLQEEAPPETTEQSVVSDGSHAPPSVCQPSSSFITMNSNEESGCSSFSDWNATAIVTVDMTGELPVLVADPHNVVIDGIDGVDCEWSDSAFACLYEEDEEGERGDGEVLLPDNGQEEASPKA